jgi:hypothetical protein
MHTKPKTVSDRARSEWDNYFALCLYHIFYGTFRDTNKNGEQGKCNGYKSTGVEVKHVISGCPLVCEKCN